MVPGAGDDMAAHRLAGRTAAALMAVPNCSEGRRADRIARLVDATRVDGVRVLGVHSDADHNRTVITLAGSPPALIEAGVRLAVMSRDQIDLRGQDGVHPRVGALDVLPFVAVRDQDMGVAINCAREAARRIADEVGVPCLLYGRAAGPGRERPALLRAAGLPALVRAMDAGQVVPDFGPPHAHPTAGVTLVGARAPLIAWNIWLPGATIDDARAIARAVRESAGEGGLPAVRALGLMCPRTGLAQVSMNLEDFHRTPPRVVVERVRREATSRGLVAGDSELVGLIPRGALVGTSPSSLGLPGIHPGQIVETHLPPHHQITDLED